MKTKLLRFDDLNKGDFIKVRLGPRGRWGEFVGRFKGWTKRSGCSHPRSRALVMEDEPGYRCELYTFLITKICRSKPGLFFNGECTIEVTREQHRQMVIDVADSIKILRQLDDESITSAYVLGYDVCKVSCNRWEFRSNDCGFILKDPELVRTEEGNMTFQAQHSSYRAIWQSTLVDWRSS